jgi:Golgi SNAP receptor complex protein 2
MTTGETTTTTTTTIEEKYKAANRLLLEVRGQMERLEAGEEVTLIESGRIAANINAVSRAADALEKALEAETTTMVATTAARGPRHELWRIRVRQLADECKSLRAAAFEYMSARDRRAREQEERAQLLEGRAGTGTGEAYARQTRLGHLVTEAQALDRSSAAADDIERAGGEILSGLEQQSVLIKGMRRKMLDFVGTLGLSRSVMRAFSRRTVVDRWLVFGGMALTLIVIFILFFWVKSLW